MLLCTKQWIASRARPNWLLKLRISLAFHLRATRAGFAPENIVIVAEMNKRVKILFLCYIISLF